MRVATMATMVTTVTIARVVTVSATMLLASGCGNDAAPTVDGNPASDGPDVATCETTTPWAKAPAMARGPTQETATVAVDGKIYVVGGFDDSGTVLDTIQIFDVAACAWSMGPALPKPVHHANVAAEGGTIYVLGALETLQFAAIGDVWSWNPAIETAWQTKTSMPAGTERGAAQVGVVGGRIHVAGGIRNGTVADHSIYDPAADKWTNATALPDARDHGCGAGIAGRLYVVGGRGGNIGNVAPTVFEFLPGTGGGPGTWSTRAEMPTARGGVACGVVADRLIVVGGEGNGGDPSGVFPQTESYDPATDAWTSHANMPTPRHGMGAAAWDGKLYVPGGATVQGFGAVATHEVFTP